MTHRRISATALRLASGLLVGATVLSFAPIAEAAPGRPLAVSAARQDAAALQQDLRALVADGGATGALAELREDGRPVWRGSAGVADLGAGRPVPVQGRFRIGSVTKTFVATVVLQLRAEGRVNLDDSIESYLPGVVPGGGAITVRQVLSHTAGIFNYTEDPTAVPQDESGWLAYLATGRWETRRPEDLVRTAVGHPPYFAPGQGWHYSNTDYILAGMLIEYVTGRPWAEEVRERILDPLGLHHSSFPETDTEVPGPHAHGYLQLSTGPADITEFNPSWAGSAGDGISTADDLARFNAALLGGELLRPAELAEMKTISPAAAPGEYGLGLQKFSVGCGDLWGHSGSVPGYETLVVGDPSGHRQLVISVTPYDQSKAGALASAGAKLLDQAACGRSTGSARPALGSTTWDVAGIGQR
ncbi:serine hydrolase domain-containing protein [Kitasatospora sp. NPDC001175]